MPEQTNITVAMMAVPFDGLFFLFEKTKAARFSPFFESLLGVVSIYAGNSLFWHISWIFIL